MANKFFKRHFTWKQLSPLHDTHTVFVTSQWQVDKSQPNLIFLIYRFLLAAFFMTTWIIAIERSSSPFIFFTMWGYTVATLQFTLAFLLKFSYVLSVKIFKTSRVLAYILKLYPLYWIVHGAATASGFVISIIFWSVLYESSSSFTAMNFFVHGSNSILLMIDLWIIAHPIRILHFVYPILFGLAYMIFSIAYYFYDTNRGGVGYVYFILNWAEPLYATLVIIGVLILAVLFHGLGFAIHVLKLMIHSRLYEQNKTQSREELNGGMV